MKEKKQKPKVISYNKYVSDIEALTLTISTLEDHIKDKDLQLEHRYDIVARLEAKDKELKHQYNLFVINHDNLKENYDKSKEYWETNTKTLHNEMDNLKAQISALKLSNKGFEIENKELIKNQKKWYHFF